jgi:signal transduction histidine kinase
MSKTETHEINFKPKAHILVLLGEELIKSPVMAIYELIKNGYDADAKEVKVNFRDIETKDNGIIEISDSGTGITSEILESVWFEPGTDFRKPVTSSGERRLTRSPIFNRIPMGEKGVGRFAVHKLGHVISLVSRPAKITKNSKGEIATELLDYELIVNIDWRQFSQSKYLDDVKIIWEKNYDKTNFKFPNSHGTIIEISNLKEPWSRGMARQLKRNTISMVSPKNNSDKFKIVLDFNNWWLNDFPETDELIKVAPYQMNAFVDDNLDLTFEYSFKTFNNPLIGTRRIGIQTTNEIDKPKYKRNIKGELRGFLRERLEKREFDNETIEKLLSEFDDSKLPIGNLMVEMNSYDLDSLSLKDTINSPSLIKELLRDHSGIKVFKGDLRVFDYGDPGKDWLGLDLKRVQNKEWFSNNQNVGFVFLDAANSSQLIEKTNREGFIENAAFEYFVFVIEFLMSEFKAERHSDRNLWLKHHKKGNGNSFGDQVSGFKELINELPNDSAVKDKLIQEAEKLEARYEEDKNTLLIPAGVGMTASFAMHEIEKLVPRLKVTAKEEPINKPKLTQEVEELEDYVNGILSVLKKGGIKSIPLFESINQAINNYSLKLKLRKIQIEVNYDKNISSIKCDKRLLITMLMNLIDNSIYWLDSTYSEDKGIYISTRKTEKGISVLVVDNGPGFKDKIEDIIRPFFSRKEGGIGIGMYLIDTVMIQFGKLNIITDKEELSSLGVPSKYNGAAVELNFNKLQ